MEYYTVLQKSKWILHAHVQNDFQGKISKMQGLQTVLWFCGEDTSVCTCISVPMLQLGTDTEERCSLYTFSLKKFISHMKMLSIETNFQVWNICRENKRFNLSQNMHLLNCVSLSEIHNVDQQMLLWLQQHLFPAHFPANFICTIQANFCLQ